MRPLLALMAFAPTTALNLHGLDRRAALALAAPTALFTAAAPAAAMYNPLNTMSRLVESTKAKRLRDAAKDVLEDEAMLAAEEAVDAQIDATMTEPPVADELYASTPAGLAKVDAELNEAYALAEDADVPQLRLLLRRSVFISFLGYAPDSATNTIERQLQLLATFPAKSRREAAATLKKLTDKLSDLDKSLAADGRLDGVSAAATKKLPATASATTLTATVLEAKGLSKQFTELFLVDGCLVCPDQISASRQDDGFDNPNLRKLKEFEPRLLRRPDERNEEVARQLGFREGELIGGY